MPRAIFLSLVIVVMIYVLVAVVAIGAVNVPEEAGSLPVWDYLAEAKEVAIVRAAEQIMGGWGGILILVSGLASTMSVLNATIYSSSRVSFAMGRDNNLPAVFGRIHPHRCRSPMWNRPCSWGSWAACWPKHMPAKCWRGYRCDDSGRSVWAA